MRFCECGCGEQITNPKRRFASSACICRLNNRTINVGKQQATGEQRRQEFEAQFADGRICKYCNRLRPLEEFLVTRKNRYQARCRDCQAIARASAQYNLDEASLRPFFAQDVCAICGEEARVVDHNHSTGEVRGRLCRPCNIAIGFMQDDPDRLMAAAAYLLQSVDLLKMEQI